MLFHSQFALQFVTSVDNLPVYDYVASKSSFGYASG